ncbi:MAG: hypothetical protein J1F68_04760 [Clostridiales bacterium]|nr:hypothetical protein [Clostridiales bacterium]
MTKNKWIVLIIILVCAAMFLTIFAVTFKAYTGVDLPWWAFIAALVIFALIVYLVIILSQRSSKRFESLLLSEGIVTDRQYKWGNYLLYVDFASSRLANNYLSTREIIQFADVAGFRLETYRTGEDVELSDEQSFVSLVISFRKEGFEYEYQYLPVFEVKVESADIEDVKQISPQLVDKYPELSDMLALQDDLNKILEINAANGIRSNIQYN